MELLNKTQVKHFVHENKLKLGRDVFDMLEKRLIALLNESIKRAKENLRKTLLGRDL